MANLSEKQVEQYSSLIEKRIETIEGNWQIPWINTDQGKPRNFDGRPYNGLNSMMLNMHSSTNGYEHPVYTTFFRAKEEGIRINAGEKGVLVSYLGHTIKDRETNEKISPEEYKSLSTEDKLKYDVTPFVKVSPVFNLDQTNIKEARPELWAKIDQDMRGVKEAINRDDSFKHAPIDHLIKEDKWIIPIKEDQQPRAYYSPANQIIHLPEQKMFKSNEDYYATALHEMAHSTEVPLKRDISNYGREELVAELTASIVASNYDFPKHIQDSNTQYIKSWLDNIKESPSFLKEVLEDVHKSSNFIIKEVENNYKVVAEINRLATDGSVGETLSFHNEEKFLKVLEEALQEGDPITYHLPNPTPELEEKVKQVYTKAYGLDEPNVTDKQLSNQQAQESQRQEDIELKRTIGEKIIEDKALFQMYANPHLMTEQHMTTNKIEDPSLLSLVQEREQLLKSYAVNKDVSTLQQKEVLEDKIREHARELYQIPALPNRDQKLDLISNHIERVTGGRPTLDEKLIVQQATYSDISITIKEPLSQERMARLHADAVDFKIVNGNQLQYDARIRYKEGWTMENTPDNKSLLEDLSIKYHPLGKDKLYIASTEDNVGALTHHTDKLTAIAGIGTLPKLKEESLELRLNRHQELSEEDKQSLLLGKAISKPEGADMGNRIYYIDRTLNQLGAISAKDMFIPRELSGVVLKDEQIQALRDTKDVAFFDKENHVHYKATLDPQEHNNVRLEYRTSLSEQFKSVPTPSSPDSEKERYVALKGATGIDDIWGREGVKLEKESFLERYNVQEPYREYLLLKAQQKPGNTIEENRDIVASNKAIKDVLQREEKNSMTYSR